MELSQEYLRTYFQYDKETGNFIRIKKIASYSRWKIGEIAGHKNDQNYIKIRILGRLYSAHRLAFLYVKGHIPAFIDHIDGNPSNNSWKNLREATHQENCRNRPGWLITKTGYKNVTWNKGAKKYEVHFKVNYKTLYFGIYTELEDAVKVAKEVREKLHKDFANHDN